MGIHTLSHHLNTPSYYHHVKDSRRPAQSTRSSRLRPRASVHQMRPATPRAPSLSTSRQPLTLASRPTSASPRSPTTRLASPVASTPRAPLAPPASLALPLPTSPPRTLTPRRTPKERRRQHAEHHTHPQSYTFASKQKISRERSKGIISRASASASASILNLCSEPVVQVQDVDPIDSYK